MGYIKIKLRISTENLLIKKSMSKLFQSFVYNCLPQEEHLGYSHNSGKKFKSMNFRIRYIENYFIIDFTSFFDKYIKILAIKILKDGIKLGNIHITETTIEYIDRKIDSSINSVIVRGDVCAAIKNRVTGKKIFLEPGDSRHTEIITNHTLQKFEALLGKPYTKELLIEPLWQSLKPRTFWYEKTPYIAWFAKYKIQADSQMLNLLLDTGLGGDSMKNLGFLEVVECV